MYRTLIGILLLLISQLVVAQSTCAYTDFNKHFIVFDNGTFRQIEFQEVRSYSIGTNTIAYVDNGGSLKAYHNHVSYDVSPSVTDYTTTDNLCAFQVGSQLYVFDRGLKKMLTAFAGSFQIGDSIVAFIDTNKHFFSVYYNGQITPLADIIVGNDAQFWLGSNTVAFTDMHDVMHLICSGKHYEIFNVIDKIDVHLGRNIGAFVDHSDGLFRIFYNGEMHQIEQFAPKSFKCGYESVAYINDMENFKLFANGEIHDISGFAPDMYDINRNHLVYSIQNEFFAYIDGQSVLIENYVPSDYNLNGNILTYIDQNNYLCIYDNGEKQILSYNVNEYQCSGNVVIFNEGLNTTKIYYNGKIYKR